MKKLLCTMLLLIPGLALSSQSVVTWGDSLTANREWQQTFTQLSGVNTIVKGYGGFGSTGIVDKFLRAPEFFDEFAVIWVGRNNYHDPVKVKEDIANMVAHLTTDNYIIMSIINGNYGSEVIGMPNYNTMINLNSDLSTLYGNHYLDIRSILVASFNPALPADVLNHLQDTVPASLRWDNVHLSAAGNVIVGTAVYNKYLTLVPLPNVVWLFLSGFGFLVFGIRNKHLNEVHFNNVRKEKRS